MSTVDTPFIFKFKTDLLSNLKIRIFENTAYQRGGKVTIVRQFFSYELLTKVAYKYGTVPHVLNARFKEKMYFFLSSNPF